ncbi:hypothetical protein [Neorhizobium tomejilense]|uniref:hypothetical protein n=1 Tax=Neorhizobium tomejilense TaxID=2093828 RepID=UPI003F50C0F0
MVCRQGPRYGFRVQIQGPHAADLMKEVTKGTLPEIKFFSVGEFQIVGEMVRAFRHGMPETPEFEIYGKMGRPSGRSPRSSVPEHISAFGKLQRSLILPAPGNRLGCRCRCLPSIRART